MLTLDGPQNKLDQLRYLTQCLQLVWKSGACPETTDMEKWWKIISFAHKSGYLYVGFKEPGEVDVCAIAYRIKDLDGDPNKFPIKEEGSILYCPLAASISEDKTKLFKLMRYAFRQNPEVGEIAYHFRNNDDLLKRHKVRGKNGKEERT